MFELLLLIVLLLSDGTTSGTPAGSDAGSEWFGPACENFGQFEKSADPADSEFCSTIESAEPIF